MNDCPISPHRAKKPEIRHVCTDFLLQNDCLQIMNKGFRGTVTTRALSATGSVRKALPPTTGVFADDRLAAEDGRAGVDGGAVAHGGVAFAAAVSATARGLSAPSVTP